MNKFCILFFAVTCHLVAWSQVNTAIKPLSLSLPENYLPAPTQAVLSDFDLTSALSQDKEETKSNNVPKISRSLYTNLGLDNSGNWSELPNGDRIWRIQVVSGGALGLLPYFDRFYLPAGSYLHVYSPDMSEIIGAFTSANNPIDGYYCTGLVHGESCILEYYEPSQVRGKGALHINEVGHAYQFVNEYFALRSGPDSLLGFASSDPCEVNVNCEEGSTWSTQKRSSTCIIIQGVGAQYLCSGTLINNVQDDCTPYLLSADHCGVLSLPYQYGQWVFYFNFQAPGCSEPFSSKGLTNDFITGCVKLADSDDDGGQSGSDFLLLKLRQSIPSSYDLYLSGWSNVNAAPDAGVDIHHPQGDIAKISTYTSQALSGRWGNLVDNTHWVVTWAATANGHGVTEPGSSGSALYNQQGVIVGQLTGGSSACGSDSSNSDYFGKFSFDWTSNGVNDTNQLFPFLDPNNTGATTLNGREANCPTGINSPLPASFTFKISPNPTNGLFFVDFGNAGDKKIEVWDALGRMITENKTSAQRIGMDLSHYAKGVYYITCKTGPLTPNGGIGNEVATQKIVIE